MGNGLSDPLLPVLRAGETLTIQRNVDGQNVLMFVEAVDPCSISPRGMTLKAVMKKFGVSSYADGRVENQRQSIERLLRRVEEAERLIRMASWDQQPGEVEEQANAWLRNETTAEQPS